MSRIPRVPTAIITAAALLAAGLAVLTLGRGATAAEGEKPYVDIVSKANDQEPAYRNSVSSDGRWVAFEGPDFETQGIWLKEQSLYGSKPPEKLPLLQNLTAITPSLSGDAGLVALQGGEWGSGLETPLESARLYVLNRRDAERPVLKQVSGNANDLPYLRLKQCVINGEYDNTGCSPKLSRDGTTLVAPVRQAVDSPNLEVTVDGKGLGTDSGLYPVMDYGAFSTSGQSTISLKNVTLQAIVFPDTGPVIAGDAQFTIAANTCAAVLRPNQSCSATVKFTGGADCTAESNGVLRFPADSGMSQTAIKLTGGGECPRLAAFPSALKAAAATPPCTGQSEYKNGVPQAAEARPADDGHPGPWFPLPGVDANELGIAAFVVHNSMSVPHVPELTSPGCQLKLVLPEGAPAEACKPGQPLAPQSSCTAYVEYNFPEVTPFSAAIHVGDTVYRIGGHAARNVIAAWRDAGASGTFGAAQIVSVTSGPDGVAMSGTAPTVSADGRYVGYSSGSSYGRPANDPAAQQYETQIYRHDMDSAGDRTYKSGETALVSQNANGSLEYTAREPSLSDDGNRIAFGADSNNDIAEQVWVRDIAAKKSILASSSPQGGAGTAASHQPVLSGDGYTVAYLSSAANLGVGSLPGDRVIGRDLTKDFTGGRGTNELLSPRPDGTGSPEYDRFISLSQDGTQAYFASNDQLQPSTDTDERSDVYQARRQGSVTESPNPLDFGTTKVGTSAGPIALTVTNDGTVPVKYGRPSINSNEFALADDQCVGTPIRPGQSCSFLLKFTPRAIGVRDGHLHTTNTTGSGSQPSIGVPLSGRGTSDAKVAGETRHVSTNSSEHRDPAINDSGQFVAYRTRTTLGDSPYNQINVRNQAGSEVKLLGQHYSVGPPSISADGSRVAYEAGDNDRNGPNPHVIVADGTSKREITGLTSDLRYQRECPGFEDRDCRPSISGDGKTVAFGAELDARPSDQLDLKLQDNGTAHEITSLIDMGNGGSKTLTVTTGRAIKFTEKPTVDSGTGFSVGQTTCAGDLAAGASCTIEVRFNACGGASNGVLRLNGATPEAQAAIALVANNACIIIKSQPRNAKAAAADCVPIARPSATPTVSTGTTSAGNVVAEADRVGVGATTYLAVDVPAQSTAQKINFVSGCDFELLTPTTTEPERPTCVQGQQLPPNTGCTAVVGYRPRDVVPASAYLTTNGESSSKSFRFGGNATRQVILTRTDTAGDGTFAGAPEIASVDPGGAIAVGLQPSLSADGRYLAFTGIYGIDDPETATTQVYRRDRTAKTTALVSKLADGNVGADDADQPSLSASGDRVAFHVDGYEIPTAARKAKAKAEFPSPHVSQIWARDLSSSTSILVSSANGKPGADANGWSNEPSISDDGSTVGFTSKATNLADQPGTEDDSVYVRYIDPDFAGAGDRYGERVSLTEEGAVPEDGSSTAPTLSADGAFTAFESTSDLVAGAVDDGLFDIFVRRRPAQLVATPASADFGAVEVSKSSSAREVVVKNVGNGPTTAGPATTAAPFIAGSNVCTQTLRRGQSCTIDARFAPATVGAASGTLSLPNKQGYLAGPALAVGLTGTGTPLPPTAGFSVVPGSLTFPATEAGKASPPQTLKLQNNGTVALDITATVNGKGDFGMTLGTCTTILPGVACDVPAVFAPRGTGARTGSVVFTPKATDPAVKSPAPVTVGLSGSGTPGKAVASMTVAPTALAFGPQLLTVPSAPKSITVTNTGTVPLTLSSGSTAADFRPAVTCAPLQPGKTCAIAVRFVPQLLGARAGTVQVAATATGAVAPFPVPVKVSGTTLTPTLVVEPPVARPGQIVIATGTNFPPGRAAVLGWDVGLGGQPAVADKTGKFVAPVLVYRRDVLGQRVMTATVPGLVSSSGRPLPVKSQPVLVMPLSYQPPNFVLRW